MYAALSLKRLANLLLWPFGAILLVLLALGGMPESLRAGFKLVSSALTYWGVAIFLVFGFSGRFAPWRLVWRLLPVFNRMIFPDLNGVWTGTTSSNWPVIAAMLDAAEGGGRISRQALPGIALQENGLTMTITASLFAFRISASLDATDGKSYSLIERVTRDKRRDLDELYYVYRQETPQPVATDEDNHIGAASLTIDTAAWTLEGPYWTRRSWRSGLNTAGIIKVARQSR